MRKLLYAALVAVLCTVALHAQQNDNVEVVLPGSNAVSGFQVKNSDTTLLFRIDGSGVVEIPGMTKAAREAISSPTAGMIVFQRDVEIGLYFYDGTAWRTLPAGSVTTATISNNAVTTIKIADGAVTTAKIADGAVTTTKLFDGAVTSSKLSAGAVTTGTVADGAITTSKLGAGSVTTTVLADGSVTAAKLGASAVTTGTVMDGAITSSKLGAGSVTTTALADGSITSSKMGTASVTEATIADGAITAAKLAPGVLSGALTAGSVTTGTLADDAVTSAKILNGSVTSAKILDSTIVSADISPTAAIPYSKLVLTNSIANGDIVANAITTSKVANGTVTTSKMADSAISGLKLLTYAVTNRHIADGAVTPTKVDPTGASSGDVLRYNGTSVVWGAGGGAPSGAAGGDLTGTYPNPTLANNTITSAKILDSTLTTADISASAAIPYSKLVLTNSIQNGDIVANAITTSKVANGTVTTSKLADSAVSGLKLLTYAVTNRHLATAAVTPDKVDPSGASSGDVLQYNGTSVVWAAGGGGAPTGAAGGDLTGTYPNPTLANSSVTGAKILDSTITTADIAAGAGIQYAKLTLTNSIQNGDIVANAITTSKVANGTVTTSKLADSAVSGLKLLTYAVTNRHIAAAAVTPDKVSSTGAVTGDVLIYNGSSVAWGAGGSTLSYGEVTAAASTSIPGTYAMVVIRAGVGSSFNISLPTGTNGQQLTIYNSEGFTATVTSGNVLNAQTTIATTVCKRYIWVTTNSTSGWVGQ